MFPRSFNLPLTHQDSLFIFGPRGTGKTQWLKHNLSNQPHTYIDLLDPLTYRTLKAKPETLREKISLKKNDWIVLDEVQKIPELLNEVHRLIEHEAQRFILTGSSARKLKRDGINLLAGRAIQYHMHPLTIQELDNHFKLEHALTLGMLPATYTYADPAGYLATYIDIYLREEVIQEGLTRNVSAFSRFLEVASFSQGAVINATEIAREVGVNRQVIQNYFSILNDLLLAHMLPAFTKKAKRRLITTNKFYYFDAGVYAQLRPKGILDAPSEIAGMGLETLFYQSLLALIDYHRINFQVYYWKTTTGTEVDFIVYGEKKLLAFEIKHNATITPKMLHGLRQFKTDYAMAELFIVYTGRDVLHLAHNITALPIESALKKLPELLTGTP
ncbi:MAG: AAA family ATPase [Gammaproteobacteria bacterium]|nr:AAA family ATPase [Gammaproteobacteria bacterium]